MNLTFGLGISTSAAPGSDVVAQARYAEQMGFDFVSASDHPCGTHASHETWTMLAWVAASTTRIGIASRVLGVPYRPPAMVAKMAQTLNLLSENRLILGLGGGYSDDEFRAFGLDVPTPAQKVTGLADAITIARGLWSTDAFTFAGQRYHTDAATIAPRPSAPIPIWLGTFGDRALDVTGRLADGWIPSHGYMAADDVPRMRDRIFAAAIDAGRDPETITLAYNLEVSVDDAGSADPDAFVGPVEVIVERMLHYVGLGFTTFNFITDGDGSDRGQIERVATEVIPELRSAMH